MPGPPLRCELGDVAAGQSVLVALSSPTSTGNCPGVSNSASVTSTNDGPATFGPVPVTINCPVAVPVPAPPAPARVLGQVLARTGGSPQWPLVGAFAMFSALLLFAVRRRVETVSLPD